MIAFDDEVDDAYFAIEEGIQSLLARQTPVATDLRLVLAMLHVNLHLERMADYCVTVAKLTKLAATGSREPRIVASMAEMGVRAEEMTRVALRSFQHRDVSRAEALVDLDELIDRANRRLAEHVLELGADQREWGLRMLVVSRCLERIGDHAVDIGEQTAYLVTGEFREFTDASHPEAYGAAQLPWPAVRRGLFLLAAAVVLLAGAAPLGAAPKPVVRFAFTGDIAMVAGPVRVVLQQRLARPRRGRRARQPRGHAHRPRLDQVRRGELELLRLPRAALVRDAISATPGSP